MKKILLALLAIGLIQSSAAYGQEEGGHRHGGSRDEGGFKNAGSPRAERSEPAEEPVEKSEPPKKIRQSRPQNQNIGNPVHRSRVAAGIDGSMPVKKGNRPHFNRVENQPGGAVRREMPSGTVSGNAGRHPTASLPVKVRAMGITRFPEPIKDHSKILRVDRKHSVMVPPREGPGGKAIGAKVFAAKAISGKLVLNHMTSITKNAAFATQINIYNRSETMKNNYYWHSGNGFNYCHYYDNWGYHWYGWYLGPHFFWTRYYGDNWWWYDGNYDRWCYWHDGGWWWQDPERVNVVYVYNDNAYTPVQTSSQANNQESNQVVYQSNDGTRKVKIMGDGRDAFLYDSTQSPSFDPVYLASGVKDIKFSDTSNNKPLQVMLTLQDGTFQMFDAYGNPYNQSQNDSDN